MAMIIPQVLARTVMGAGIAFRSSWSVPAHDRFLLASERGISGGGTVGLLVERLCPVAGCYKLCGL